MSLNVIGLPCRLRAPAQSKPCRFYNSDVDSFKAVLTVVPNPTLFDKNVNLDFQYLLNRAR